MGQEVRSPVPQLTSFNRFCILNAGDLIGVNNMSASAELQDLDFIDLLNERQRAVQKMSQQTWDDENGIYISDSGWSIIASIYDEPLPISHVTKKIDITRQAIHKFIKRLSEKGLIEVYEMPNDKKKKCVALTDLGKRCYRGKVAHNAYIEKGIAEKLGDEKMLMLKDILKSDWGI